VAGDFGDPADRERLLAGVDPQRAGERHELLRTIFRAEMGHRAEVGDSEYVENLYWCAFLLHLVGDPADVPMMWQAKHLDFDTGCGFDVQFMLGAGAQATLSYLADHGHAEIAQALSRAPELGEDIDVWRAFRRSYFYGEQNQQPVPW
jgi:hypothetical protein